MTTRLTLDAVWLPVRATSFDSSFLDVLMTAVSFATGPLPSFLGAFGGAGDFGFPSADVALVGVVCSTLGDFGVESYAPCFSPNHQPT